MWYQPPNGCSWLGPAAVLCHRGPSIWLPTVGDIKKVVSCKVKPYELLDRENNKNREVTEKIMLEDGLKNVDKEADLEKEKLKNAKIKKVLTDNVGKHYLKVVNHVFL